MDKWLWHTALHTPHCTLHTLQYALYSLRNAQCTLQTRHFSAVKVGGEQLSEHRALQAFPVKCTLHSNTLWNALFTPTLCEMHSSLKDCVKCTLHSVIIIWEIHSVLLHTVKYTLTHCEIHFALWPSVKCTLNSNTVKCTLTHSDTLINVPSTQRKYQHLTLTFRLAKYIEHRTSVWIKGCQVSYLEALTEWATLIVKVGTQCGHCPDQVAWACCDLTLTDRTLRTLHSDSLPHMRYQPMRGEYSEYPPMRCEMLKNLESRGTPSSVKVIH